MKPSLCPSFWCRRCVRNHPGECVDQPGMSYLGRGPVDVGAAQSRHLLPGSWPTVGSKWQAETSNDNGATWALTGFVYEVTYFSVQHDTITVRLVGLGGPSYAMLREMWHLSGAKNLNNTLSRFARYP